VSSTTTGGGNWLEGDDATIGMTLHTWNTAAISFDFEERNGQTDSRGRCAMICNELCQLVLLITSLCV
jgi:hypothetical protein